MTRILSRKLLSVLLALVIVAAMVFALASCGHNNAEKSDDTTAAQAADSGSASGDAKTDDTTAADVATQPAADDTAGADAVKTEKTITVDVVDDKGETTTFTITTAAENLEDALLQEKLVEGTDSEYGLMITHVNGLRADYNEDGAYWAMFQDGEYMMTGARDTIIADGDHYELVYTKA